MRIILNYYSAVIIEPAMEKRSAARELAFLALFQLPQKTENIKIDKLAKTDLDAICLSAIRTLAEHSKDNIKQAEAFFIKTERYLMEHQVNHELNEPLDQATRPVPIPKTDEFFNHLNNCYQAIGLMREGLQIPEVYWHYHDIDTKEFCLDLIFKYIQNKEEVEGILKEISQSWDISRMHKVDRKLLELAITELGAYDLPNAVVISETIKIANKYSTEEGVKFINGILSDVLKLLKDPV